MSLPNKWHLRRVAENSARACLVCHKPSTSVLITPDNKDFFYVCPVHLKDRNFCSPIIDTEQEEAKKRKEALAQEIEMVKKEYEEKQKRKREKKEKEKEKEKEKKDEKDKSDSKEKDGDGEDDAALEKEKNDRIAAVKAGADKDDDSSPRIFALHKNFQQMRIDRLRNIELAKRNMERLRDPSLFPSVPTKEL
ncbi:hypothetical protein ASPZODRAFT_134835 [Penicilliopsis zonata CBS 506.65]|uniref:VPS4-associated protein 1 n=1 Tax=Penicilliopsis zonata CBS 506.65 TaxID=1073090 RepID=A0A1L9SC60_9EURO|nr:hypothetical protein ASPZODRAFT_134835 [Penicilliopsis zonata CBS 506.65]OJJ44729.1 hypothetical protein ASPZODRAFT_134835 [Penicilliopsis zonata CBS 506.65]